MSRQGIDNTKLKNVLALPEHWPNVVQGFVSQFNTEILDARIEGDSSKTQALSEVKNSRAFQESTQKMGCNFASHVKDDGPSVQYRRETLEQVLNPEEDNNISPLNANIQWLDQVHGVDIVNLDDHVVRENQTVKADASFTTQKNKICVISTADCLPIIITDKQSRFVAAVHAGWKGLYQGILEELIGLAVEKVAGFCVTDVQVFLAPAICQLCYEVDEKFYQAFVEKEASNQQAFMDKGQGKYLADLKAIAKLQLEVLGVKDINDAAVCSKEDDRFYSHRGNPQCGRFSSFVWLS